MTICSKCGQEIEDGDAFRVYGSTYRHLDKFGDGCVYALVNKIKELEEKVKGYATG